MTVKLMKGLAGALLLALVLLPAPGECLEDLDTLLQKRSGVVWVEGQALGDMIIGARAQVTFIAVDGKLTETVWNDPAAPEWLKSNVAFSGDRRTRKKSLFIILVKTIRNFTLELPMISIGTHALSAEDVLTNKHYVPVGDLPPDLTAPFAVVVPSSAVKGGKFPVRVGEYSIEMELPKR